MIINLAAREKFIVLGFKNNSKKNFMLEEGMAMVAMNMPYAEETAELIRISDKYNENAISEKLQAASRAMDNFKVKVLFVGGFNAGKSALLNAALGRDILAEAVTPQTAIAAELVYGTDEYVELIGNGNLERCSFEDAAKKDVSKYKKFVYHIDSEFLKTHREFVPVDMPGFDSDNGGHDKAIALYAADSGNAYVLCVDCNDGTVRASVADGLKEIRNYTDNLACILTKSDKIDGESLSNVYTAVAGAVEHIFEEKVHITSASTLDESAKKSIENSLSVFRSDDLFKQAFSPELTLVCELLYNSLTAAKQNTENPGEDATRTLQNITDEKSKIEQMLKKDREKLRRKMSGTVKQAVSSDVEIALCNAVTSLVSAAKGGSESLSRTISGVARPAVISSIQKHAGYEIDLFIADVSTGIGELSADGLDASTIQGTLEKVLSVLKDNSGKYRLFAGSLAIATSVIAPWLEIVILFLPEIFSVLRSIFDWESGANDQIEGKIRGEIIPQVVNQLLPKIDEILAGIERDATEKIEETFNAQITAIEETIKTVREKKKKSENEYKEFVGGLDCDLAKIRAIEDSVRV
jgi:GTP-binding protein EngB required for normal cell division